MSETYAIQDPFLNKTVEISHNLTDRLRGKYACGPVMANGEPEFGWREFPTPPVQHEAAAEIERLRAALPIEFERGKDVGKAIGWSQAKEDSAKILAALGSMKNG